MLYMHTVAYVDTPYYVHTAQFQSTEHYLHKVTLHLQRSVKRHLRLPRGHPKFSDRRVSWNRDSNRKASVLM